MAVPPFRVNALYDYNSKEVDDLKFSKGQIIKVTDEEDADWYFGEFKDDAGDKQEGLFPKNFVKIYEPETPPRPSRAARPKKELDQSAPLSEVEGAPSTAEPTEAEGIVSEAAPTSAIQQSISQSQQEEHLQNLPTQVSKNEIAPLFTSAQFIARPAPPPTSKASPPSNAENPGRGSFRDRINAFNKPAAPPVAPMKPSGLGTAGGSGFIKKPFVAPPPSKNAYLPPPREQPPQRISRRDDVSDVAAPISKGVENEELHAPPQAAPTTSDSEEQSKPASLKDRIALLQKQQMEQGARHAEASQKKEKPKRPPKKQVEQHEASAGHDEDAENETIEGTHSAETTVRPSRTRKSQEDTPLGSPNTGPARDLLNDPNDADQSAMGETEDGEELSTGRDDSDDKPLRKNTMPLHRPAQMPVQEADEEDNAEEDEAEEEDEEGELDPEVRRRMEIRERMAKMSGGMGMAGMFGPPGVLPSRTSTKQSLGSADRKASLDSGTAQEGEQIARAPPVPMMPMPGLQKIRGPEQQETSPEVSKEEEFVPKSIAPRHNSEAMPDIEDVQEEPMPPPRRSTERTAPAPLPQGKRLRI